MSFENLSAKLKATTKKRVKDLERRGLTHFVFHIVGTGEVIPNTKPPMVREQDAYMPAEINVFDPYDEEVREKTLMNVKTRRTRWDATLQKNVVDEEGQEAMFMGGVLYVPKDNLNLLAMAMYGHGNVSKPESLRMPGIITNTLPLQWEERRENLYHGVVKSEVGDTDFLLFALQSMKKDTQEQKKNILLEVSKRPGFGKFNPSGRTFDEIDNDFAVFVRNHPKEYMDCHVSLDTKVRGMVYDATYRGYMKHEKAKGVFTLFDREFFKYTPSAVEQGGEEDYMVKALTEVNKDGTYRKQRELDRLTKALSPLSHPYLPEEDAEVEAKEQPVLA